MPFKQGAYDYCKNRVDKMKRGLSEEAPAEVQLWNNGDSDQDADLHRRAEGRHR